MKQIFKLNSKTSFSDRFYFYLFIIFHIVIWTILPILVRNNLNLDTIEAISWGHEWQLGYYKHPPMSAWLSEAMIIVFGNKMWSVYLLSQLCIASTFIAVWKLAKIFLPPKESLLSVLLLECIYYYNFTSVEFNPNVLMMSVWAWATYFSWKIYDKNRLVDWLSLAFIAAIGMLSKYVLVILMVCFALFLLYEKKLFRYLKTPNPYLAVLLFLALFFPHINWLINNDFAPLEYAESRLSGTAYHFYNHLLFPASFFISQLFSLAFAIIAFLSFKREKLPNVENIKKDPKALFLIFMLVMPYIFTTLPSIIFASKIRDMYGAPLWSLFGIALFYFYKPIISKSSLRSFYKKWAIIICLSIIAYSILLLVITNKYSDFNGQYVADEVTKYWQKETGHKKLEIVVGNIWLSSNINFFSIDRPHVFIDMKTERSSWLSYAEFEQKGGMIIWDAKKEGDDLPDNFKGKVNNKIIVQKPLDVNPNNKNGKPSRIGWAIAYPIK